MITGELKAYQGDFSYQSFYINIAAIGSWLNSFKSARLHDQIPVVYSTTQRAYFLNQLSKYGFNTINNRQIPTPIISYWLSDQQHKQAMDHPMSVKYFNRDDGCLYPDLIPWDCTYTVSIWTRKQSDMFEIEYQLKSSFNQGIHWIYLTDQETGRRQTMPIFLEGVADASNYEPGETGEPEWRKDYTLRAECYLPRPGSWSNPIKKIFVDIGTGNDADNCNISYVSGTMFAQKVNEGTLCGVIEDGRIYFSGTVNQDQPDEEYVEENLIF